MSVQACAELVARGDPDRFAAAMAAPVSARPVLFPLYAFNLEVARAPWLTQEPMIAEMRLQWWRDIVGEIAQGKPPRAHEVVQPLAEVIGKGRVPVQLLDDLVEARRWDIYREPFVDRAALLAHLDATAGNLMWAAALALGAPANAELAVRHYARAAGLAAWFQAVPELSARGRLPLPDSSPDEIASLASEGLHWLEAGRNARGSLPPAVRPATLSAWQAYPLLRMAARHPGSVLKGRLVLSEASRRGRLLWAAATGRV